MGDRAPVLAGDTLCCQSRPHRTLAGRDLTELIKANFARGYPPWFALTTDRDRRHSVNTPPGIDRKITSPDTSALPMRLMECITRQAWGDFTLQDQCDDALWIGAGMMTMQADWSLDLDIGTGFRGWHASMAHELGVLDRVLTLQWHLQAGSPVGRFDWTVTLDPFPGTSPGELSELRADTQKPDAGHGGQAHAWEG